MTAMQLVSAQQHQYQLAVTAQNSGQISRMQIDDAAATEAALAAAFAAMEVDQPGKLLIVCINILWQEKHNHTRHGDDACHLYALVQQSICLWLQTTACQGAMMHA